VWHERFHTWQQIGLFDQLFQVMVQYYVRECRIGWKWQAGDSKMVPAPLSGPETGKNPTDRDKSDAKIHVRVDAWGAPLALHLSGANQHYNGRWMI
jgi:hypothetical protein